MLRSSVMRRIRCSRSDPRPVRRRSSTHGRSTAALLGESNPTEAVKRYDAERRPAMNDIVLRNRDFGPEAALQLVEERAPHGFERIEDVVSRREYAEPSSKSSPPPPASTQKP